MNLSVRAAEFIPKKAVCHTFSIDATEFVPKVATPNKNAIKSSNVVEEKKPLKNTPRNNVKWASLPSKEEKELTQDIVKASEQPTQKAPPAAKSWSSIVQKPAVPSPNLYQRTTVESARKIEEPKKLKRISQRKNKPIRSKRNDVNAEKPAISRHDLKTPIDKAATTSLSSEQARHRPPTVKKALTRTKTTFISGFGETNNDYTKPFSAVNTQNKEATPKALFSSSAVSSVQKAPVQKASERKVPNQKAAVQKAPVLSYSDMLQRSSLVRRSIVEEQPVAASAVYNKDNSKTKNKLTQAEIIQRKREKKAKRKLKKKEAKKGTAAAEQQSDPVNVAKEIKESVGKNSVLDFGGLIDQLVKADAKRKKKQQKVSVGVVSVSTGMAKRNTLDGKKMKRDKIGMGTAGINNLDGTAPAVKRGKEREKPKKKKLTLLKKIIKEERERNRLLREAEKEEKECPDELKEADVVTEKPNDSDLNKATEDNSKEQSCSKNVVKDLKEIKKTQQVSSKVLKQIPEEACKRVHTRKFREYCDQMLSKEIDELTKQLLSELMRFQDRVYHENPTKFKQKRRYVLGLREVLKHLQVKKLKAVVVASNIERIQQKGGIDDYLASILGACREGGVPVVYSMQRHALGKVIRKNAPASVVGVFNYDGAQDIFKQLMEKVEEARTDYTARVEEVIREINNPQLVPQKSSNKKQNTKASPIDASTFRPGQKTNNKQNTKAPSIVKSTLRHDAPDFFPSWLQSHEAVLQGLNDWQNTRSNEFTPNFSQNIPPEFTNIPATETTELPEKDEKETTELPEKDENSLQNVEVSNIPPIEPLVQHANPATQAEALRQKMLSNLMALNNPPQDSSS